MAILPQLIIISRRKIDTSSSLLLHSSYYDDEDNDDVAAPVPPCTCIIHLPMDEWRKQEAGVWIIMIYIFIDPSPLRQQKKDEGRRDPSLHPLGPISRSSWAPLLSIRISCDQVSLPLLDLNDHLLSPTRSCEGVGIQFNTRVQWKWRNPEEL